MRNFQIIGVFVACIAMNALPGCRFAPGPVDNRNSSKSNDTSDSTEGAEFAISEESAPSEVIPGHFIVTFYTNVDADDAEKRLRRKPKHKYGTALHGFAAELSPEEHKEFSRNPKVKLIEPDRAVHGTTITQNSPTWGLDRIDQHRLPTDNAYSYDFAGNTVRVYIVDTGINYTHSEFGGRATFGFDAFGGTGADCNGHGTHVSGTVGGATYGVAKNVSLVAVRVLDCAGSGTTSGVIAGLDWVAANRVLPAVVNMSLGGGISSSLNTAVQNVIAAGVSVAVAAGNSTADACNSSPAMVPEAMTVGATGTTDARASFSNFGSCVDWFAPGVNITSSWYTGNTAINTISGTSMATPHTAGVAALYLEHFPSASPSVVRDALFSFLTAGIVTDALSANNHLLYSREGGGVAPPPADTTPPSTSIQSPASGAVLTGSTNTVIADASDNVGVARVDLLVDGSLTGTATAPPYSFNLDTITLADGNHTLQSKAYDAAGNVGTSATVNFSVNNSNQLDTTPPAIALTNPLNGSTVTRKSRVTISATASDNVGVRRVEFYVNGSILCSITALPYNCPWTVPAGKPRSYTVMAIAYDDAGNFTKATAGVTSN